MTAAGSWSHAVAGNIAMTRRIRALRIARTDGFDLLVMVPASLRLAFYYGLFFFFFAFYFSGFFSGATCCADVGFEMIRGAGGGAGQCSSSVLTLVESA